MESSPIGGHLFFPKIKNDIEKLIHELYIYIIPIPFYPSNSSQNPAFSYQIQNLFTHAYMTYWAHLVLLVWTYMYMATHTGWNNQRGI